MILRVNKNKNYTVMSNKHLREPNMSLKAKGLLSLILSLPDTWNYSVEGLCELSKDGRDGISAGLKELEQFGYLVRTIKQDEKGKFAGYTYDIYEEPHNNNNNQQEEPFTENPLTENPLTENPQQINTNNIINKDINNNKINLDKAQSDNEGEKYSIKILENNNNHPLTEELIKRHFIESTDLDIYKYNNLFTGILESLNELDMNYADACKMVSYVVTKISESKEPISNKYAYLKTSLCIHLLELQQNKKLFNQV